LTGEIAINVPGLEECPLSLGLHFCDPLHSLYGRVDQISVVSDWDVSSLLERESRIDSHLLSSCLSESLGPLELSRVSLHSVEGVDGFEGVENGGNVESGRDVDGKEGSGR
jgi:hypothetical protein